jgi:hypothetical protein
MLQPVVECSIAPIIEKAEDRSGYFLGFWVLLCNDVSYIYPAVKFALNITVEYSCKLDLAL